MGGETSEEAELRVTTLTPATGPSCDELDDHETTEGLLHNHALLGQESKHASGAPCGVQETLPRNAAPWECERRTHITR